MMPAERGWSEVLSKLGKPWGEWEQRKVVNGQVTFPREGEELANAQIWENT